MLAGDSLRSAPTGGGVVTAGKVGARALVKCTRKGRGAPRKALCMELSRLPPPEARSPQ